MYQYQQQQKTKKTRRNSALSRNDPNHHHHHHASVPFVSRSAVLWLSDKSMGHNTVVLLLIISPPPPPTTITTTMDRIMMQRRLPQHRHPFLSLMCGSTHCCDFIREELCWDIEFGVAFQRVYCNNTISKTRTATPPLHLCLLLPRHGSWRDM